ncbi:B12-binding domain-containing radical SAM protein [Paenibacillus antibioticophila]|uniref:B12-binding domain-containing radical SAM protein n=1 Tax=Paenibacillus antibioticophila TaxID=1274374 RepID=A0A919XV35_9BACL|nr:B12-binding domain-containing radical SAM protein [Paenibacillus antibioticophila]GIO38534.1 B12-binding domain-containing radical SAM protein [Paenibacillus antibioticophila]
MKVILSTLNAKYIHTSLAIRLLKAYSGHEFDIELAEYTIKDPVLNIVSDLYRKSPDVIGFSCYIWNMEETIKVIEMLKKVLPDTLIVLGGPEVSYDADDWLTRIPGVDFIVMGDGEETFHHLLQEISGAKKYHFVFGAAYRKDGRVVLNPPRPKSDLNTLPSPHRFPEDLPDLGKRIIYFETSRGCPFSCQFCLSSIEVGVRYYDIERVKSDILYLIEHGAKTIKFLDRTFNINRSYAMEMFEFLIHNHRGCLFQFEITADIMRPEVLDYLAEHAPPGIFRFEIGVQSTNDPTNALVKRRQNFSKLTRTVMKIKESGKIDQHLDLIAGLPEEDYATFRKTFNDVFAMRPEELQLGFLKMLRGTGLRKEAAKYGYVYMDHAPYEILSNHVMSFGEIISLKRLEDVLEKYWNAHRMDHTLEYLITEEFETPFDFFQEFGDYWEERGWQRIGHQLEDLFTRLYAFLNSRGMKRPEIVLGLMKLDYYLGHKYKPRKIWWEDRISKEVRSGYFKWLEQHPEEVSGDFAALSLDERELQKCAVIEELSFHPLRLKPQEDNESGRNVPVLVLVLYLQRGKDEKPDVFYIDIGPSMENAQSRGPSGNTIGYTLN